MPNSVAKRRSRFAILATLAVVASLFTAALPASAATGDVEFPATFSACVGGATADGGFTDTSGNFADASIDCLKYYGVTIGTTATTYSPGASVTRRQMALFLIRAAGPAGITVPAASSQGFTDIGGEPQANQDAINQLAALGISKGTSTTTYSPNDIVSRYQMALFLIRFLEVQNGAATLATGSFGSGLTDLGNVSNEAFLAIEKAWDHGITKGTSATAFSPFDAVARDQMAAFIARTMAHTNARPAGVSIQAVPSTIFSTGDVDIQISVRDTAFKPAANARVDVFQAPLADKAKALKADGTCDTAVTLLSPFGGATECAIAAGDPSTDGNGNLTANNVAPAAWGGGSVIWWAWTGTIGATFDVDTTKVAAAEVVVNNAATTWKVTTTIPANAGFSAGGNQVKFGTSVTHTFQLVDAGGKNVALAGKKVSLLVSSEVNNVLQSSAVATQTSDANGTLSFVLASPADPNAAGGDNAEADINVISLDGLGIDLSKVPSSDPDVTWIDAASAAFTVEAGDDVYTTGSSLAATATVYDQYGLTMNNVAVTFNGGPNRFTVNGVATDDFARPAGVSANTSVTAAVAGLTDGQELYFVIEETANSAGAQAVLVWDAASDAVVYNDGQYTVAYYDANDQLNAGTPVSYADFDTAVGAEPSGPYANVAVSNYAAADSNISSFTLS